MVTEILAQSQRHMDPGSHLESLADDRIFKVIKQGPQN